MLFLLLALPACSGADSGTPDADPDEEPDAEVGPDAAPDNRVVKLNEVYKKQPGTDFHEFVEIVGDPSTSYEDLTIVIVESDAGVTAGTIKSAFEVGTTDADGLFTTPFTEETLSNGSFTVLLVSGFDGELEADLDAADDGTLDAAPWNRILDSVALIDDPVGVAYATTVLDLDFDGGTEEVDGAARVPDGAATWVRHDPEGAGLQGVLGAGGQACTGCGVEAASAGTAKVTPGVANELVTPGTTTAGLVLNEVYKKQPSTDLHEFIEVFGAPSTDYTAYTIVVLESDVGTTSSGVVDLAYPVGTTNAGGFYATPYTNETLENASLTVLLVTGYTGALATDLDTNDDGTLDGTPWTAIVDSVALIDTTGHAYSPTVVTNDFDLSGAGEPDGVARFPDGAHAALTDWKRHDPGANGLAGVPGQGGTLCTTCGTMAAVAGTALVSPAATNTVAP